MFIRLANGLAVMEGVTCSEGRGFKSWHHLLDGYFFIYNCCKKCNDVCLKRLIINDKRGRSWPTYKNITLQNF